MPIFQTIENLVENESLVRKRPYGMIEIVDAQLVAVHLRPWPKLISVVEAAWIGGWKHKRQKQNRCVLYYNQPVAHRNYLVLAYVESTAGTSFATFRRSLQVLDQVAKIKRSDAIMCEVTNDRIPDRLLGRWGWEPHLESSRKRHWIKRFYGDYSSLPTLTIEAESSNSLS